MTISELAMEKIRCIAKARSARYSRPHKQWTSSSPWSSGSDDPEDSPEGHDLDAMGYHHLGME